MACAQPFVLPPFQRLLARTVYAVRQSPGRRRQALAA
eukprot:CAMPEP_0181400212 /NCGR_PEP_ID=MMETSP1110-20121109/1998_1 /TAXON_ID=174948 /ORGANISM="Symbiodinium sp., Strain CCMP421" /LENGTH=36 /DNA_ID= /DNA_START= /DNA_END= /DNA_ORIENTATION=